jgi:hypothetical protein
MTYLDGGMSVAYRKIAPTFKTKLQGVLNLGVYMPIDKLMAFIFNQKWVSVKIKIAQERANKSIKKLHLEQNKSMALIDVN